MRRIKARFDGKVFVPREPGDLPQGSDVEVVLPTKAPPHGPHAGTLAKLVRIAYQMPDSPDSPVDLAAQHDHYLYGAPKRPRFSSTRPFW